MKVLVTGGAGLIGSHIVDKLLAKNHEVKILDNLEEVTHLHGKPAYIPKEAEFILGDMRNYSNLEKALKDVDIIFHEASFGGFTPDIEKYVDSNSLGTARMFEVIIQKKLPIKKIIVASSGSVYGEGMYLCSEHGIIYPKQRELKDLKNKEWEMKCPTCRKEATPIQTDEDKPLDPQAIYSITKYDQERMTLLLGKQYDIPVTALRYFVTYGPRQSLTNPYTGIFSIFSTRILNNLPPIIHEDGLQTRDFIFVEDVADANILAMENPKANQEVFNVGTGKAHSVKYLAEELIRSYNKDLSPKNSGSFREADVRHIIPDTSKIRNILGFEPKYTFDMCSSTVDSSRSSLLS